MPGAGSKHLNPGCASNSRVSLILNHACECLQTPANSPITEVWNTQNELGFGSFYLHGDPIRLLPASTARTLRLVSGPPLWPLASGLGLPSSPSVLLSSTWMPQSSYPPTSPATRPLLEPTRVTGLVDLVLPAPRPFELLRAQQKETCLSSLSIPDSFDSKKRKHTTHSETVMSRSPADECNGASEGRKGAAQDPPGPEKEAERKGAGFAKCCCGLWTGSPSRETRKRWNLFCYYFLNYF